MIYSQINLTARSVRKNQIFTLVVYWFTVLSHFRKMSKIIVFMLKRNTISKQGTVLLDLNIHKIETCKVETTR